MRPLPILLGLHAIIAGCASMGPPPSRPADQPDQAAELAQVQAELARGERALGGLTAEGQPPDCQRATTLTENICALAERICVLVERAPAPDGPPKCADARARCQAARERLRKACPKP